MNSSLVLDRLPCADVVPNAGGDAAMRPTRIVIRHRPNARREIAALRNGLLDAAAHIDPKHFYDPTGCALFEAICELPEYYPTRTEAAIFARHRAEILARLPQPAQWIDLGCGSGSKSEPWLDAVRPQRFIGVDIAQEWLDAAVRRIAARFPGVDCIGVVADFSNVLALHELLAERPEASPVFFYPGSSLGNLPHARALAFLRTLREHLGDDGCLLIGIDLVKDARILEAAYNDTQGVTAAFNRNILRVANRLLDADFQPERFRHEAHFDPAADRIEMRLYSSERQSVALGADTRVFARGESILTEYSHKYTPAGFAALLADAGYAGLRSWTDAAGWFGVFLARSQ